MKVSKINHDRTAVSMKNERPEGILYTIRNEEKDVSNNFRNSSNTAKSNYKLFNEITTKPEKPKGSFESEKSQTYKIRMDLVKYIPKINRALCLTGKENGKNVLKHDTCDKLIKRLQDARANDESLKKEKEEIHYMVMNYSKEAFRQDEVCCKVLENILLRGLLDVKDKLQPEEYTRFETKLKEDFSKEKGKKQVERSIKRQNMVIQPDKEDKLCLSGLKDPEEVKEEYSEKEYEQYEKKYNAKTAFADFLYDYASLKEEDRMCILRKIRRILDCYFYGIDRVNTDENFNVWKHHEEKKSEKESFVEEVIDNLSDTEIEHVFRRKNMDAYRLCRDTIEKETRDAKENSIFFNDQNINYFWMRRISSLTENIYKSKHKKKKRAYMNQKGYLCEKVWNALINYLSLKYIATGKALYHSGLADALMKGIEDGIDYSSVAEEKKKGISSFEYEYIKAEEQLQREASVYVVFAVNHLINATVNIPESTKEKEKEDFLGWNPNDIKENLKDPEHPEDLSGVLRFFGGKSYWEDSGIEFPASKTTFIYEIKNLLSSARNELFHYKTARRNTVPSKVVGRMFQYDESKIGDLIKRKFYSNNLWMFYEKDKLDKVMEKLYSPEINKGVYQIPAFRRVFVKSRFESEYLRKWGKCTLETNEKMIRDKWFSAVYYLYKEIYYNDFLTNSEVKELFTKHVGEMQENAEDKKEALDSFKKRIGELSSMPSLPEICQTIMTEYSLQNNGNRVKKSAKETADNPDKYIHYELLLQKSLRETFWEYIEENEENEDKKTYGFIQEPKYEKRYTNLEQYLKASDFTYKGTMHSLVKDSAELQRWYVIGRLLSSKQANQLAGVFRQYLQYTGDVCRRAKKTGNSVKVNQDVKAFTDIVKVLDLCVLIGGVTSNCLTDYFRDKEDYANYISKYVDYYRNGEEPTDKALKEFCNQQVNGERIGTFYDGENPILDRNIVNAKLFGCERVLEGVFKNCKVTWEEIRDVKDREKKMVDYKKDGVFKNEEELKKIKEYQELKTHVELKDLTEYAEIIDELQGQLINWAYLRERDLLYYQLGFHYYSLLRLRKNKDIITNYDEMKINGKTIKGAVLYQIAAIYMHGLPVFYPEKNGQLNTNKGNMTPGIKISNCFIPYQSWVLKNKPGLEIYEAGLELFEKSGEHENVIKRRNYIDHFKYYAPENKDSMMDIYSEVFESFFTYDMKYRKNVPNMLYNILAAHFVLPSFYFGSKEQEINVDRKPAVKIGLRKGGLISDFFQYPVGADNEKISVAAHGERFVKNVVRILYSPNEPPEDIFGEGDGFCFIEDAEEGSLRDRDQTDLQRSSDHKDKKDSSRSGGKSKRNEDKDKLTISLGSLMNRIDLSSLPKQ